MSVPELEWLDAVVEALANVRATLASFGARDKALEARIDAAMRCAQMLRTQALRESDRGKAA